IDTAIKGLENDKANSEDLTSLEQTVTEHLAETKKWIGASTTQAQTILSGVETDLRWDTFYNVNGADFVSIIDDKLVLEKGVYIFWAQTEFIANGNGQRRFGVAGFNNHGISDTAYDTTITVNYVINVTESNYFLPCKVYQDSGGSLNLKSGYSVIRILKVGDLD
ncbi:hypothetical protein, partial [Lysinibacillus sp. NPDC047702]|uniref:hypothetical protein n=1 Tax=unclassified Lysinibacillus TaxID=2636778 RepID=UPI003D01A60D